MRDLYKIIQLCEAEASMDYCPEFDEAKSILEYCNQHVKPFKKLCFRSGNESIINELTRRFQQMFVERELVDSETKEPLPDSHTKLRKILVFFFANTDAIYKHNLRDDPHLAHVVEICPLMPKFLTAALAWELQLDRFFYEALSFTPCWFAFQYFEAANESLKYINDALKLLIMLEELMKALLINIHLSERVQMDDIDQRIIFNKLYDQAIILLRRFHTPDSSRTEKMRRRQLERYWGISVKHLLNMILFAFDIYESKIDMETNFDVSIFKIGEGFQKPLKIQVKANSAAKNPILKIIKTMLSTLQNNVMTIKMNNFIAWAEVELEPQLSLQQAIGEMSYNIRERIEANANFEHYVEKYLKAIEIRPKTLQERVSDTTIGEILRTLDKCEKMSYENQKIWFDELFNRGTAVFGNSECLETINEHIKLITLENCKQIIDCIKLEKVYGMKTEKSDENDNSDDDDNAESDVGDEVVSLLHQAVKQLNEKDLMECIEYQQKTLGEFTDGVFSDLNGFNHRITMFFNNSTTNFDHRKFLLLCFEHPFHMWSKFFYLACNTKGYISIFCDTLRKTASLSYVLVDKIYKETIEFSATEYPYISEMMCELYFILYQGDKRSEFLANFIYTQINSRLSADDYDALVPLIKGLYLITKHGSTVNFGTLTAPMLAMVAIVKDLARWNINTYSDVRVEIVELCINFISETSKRFQTLATDKDRKWLAPKIKSGCTPITQFYFQMFMIPVGEEPLPFDCFLNPHLKKARKVTILKFLEKNLVRCTNQEFKLLTSSEILQPHISESIQILASNVSNNPHPNAIQSYQSCFGKYLNFANDILKPKCKNNSETYRLLKTVLESISKTPNEIYSQVFMEAESFLKDLLSNTDGEVHKDELDHMRKFVIKMSDCPAKTIFLQHFNAHIPSNLVD